MDFLSEQEAEALIYRLRWGESDPVCPMCDAAGAYLTTLNHRGKTRYRCKQPSCRADFTLTSGTPLAHRKASLSRYIAFVRLWSEQPKRSIHSIHMTLGVHYKSAFIWAAKLSEIAVRGETSWEDALKRLLASGRSDLTGYWQGKAKRQGGKRWGPVEPWE